MASIGERIKESVREHYTRAVTRGSCCASSPARSSCCVPADQVGFHAGYGEEVNTLPKDAVTNSFGCGNPLQFAGVEPGHVVVDIGSGAGIDCLLAAQKVGPRGRVIGIDMTPVMIQKARENARRAGAANVEFRLGDAESMPVEDGVADWIISNCVINLSPDKPRVFREAYRVLRPGGRLSISDIMVEELPEALRQSAALYSSCVAGAIPEAQYLDGIRQAGFSDVKVTERVMYDRDQMLALLEDTDLTKRIGGLAESPEALVDRYLVGKIWSAKVTARK